MMAKYVVLLRGINVGDKNLINMQAAPIASSDAGV